MTSPLLADVLELALQTLEAELVEPDCLASFRTVLNTIEPVAEAGRFRWYTNGQSLPGTFRSRDADVLSAGHCREFSSP